MAKVNILPEDTVLYSATEPEGRKFLQGEPWPGDAWFATPVLQVAGDISGEQAMKDLLAAREQIEKLSGQLASMQHAAAQADARASDAEAKLTAQGQQLRDALTELNDAKAVASEVTKERDQARAALADLQRKFADQDKKRAA